MSMRLSNYAITNRKLDAFSRINLSFEQLDHAKINQILKIIME